MEPHGPFQHWQGLRGALGEGGVPVDLLVDGQEEASWLSESRWHVLGDGARNGRIPYATQ